MQRWTGRVAVVTGASRGVGAAITSTLVQAGVHVVGVAREIQELEQTSVEFKNLGYPGNLVPVKCDISQPDEIKQLFALVKADPDLEGLDILINNAGVAFAEPLLTGNVAMWKYMMEVNVIGAAMLTQEAIKVMRDRENEEGHVIFINSLSGHRLMPGNKEIHWYSATKAALRTVLEGFRYELRLTDSKVRISGISPGVIETDIFLKLFDRDDERARKFLCDRKYLEANDIAAAVVYILSQPQHVQVHDILIRATEQIP